MNQQQITFLASLFKPEEQVCFGNNVWDTEAQYIFMKEQELLNTKIRNTPFITLNPIKERRSDKNVTEYRNILLEFDKHSIKTQHSFIKRNKIPYSALTFSGGKSLHCIISLKEGVKNEEEYRQLVGSVYELLDPEDKWLDKTCKNPSRFTRLPGVFRPDKNKLQELIALEPSITLYDLQMWMIKHKNYPKLAKELVKDSLIVRDRNDAKIIKKITKLNNVSANQDTEHREPIDVRANYLSRRAEAFLLYGPNSNQNWRTEALFACCDLARCGFDEDEIHEQLLNIDGYLNEDSESIPSYAIRTVLTSGELGIRLEDE